MGVAAMTPTEEREMSELARQLLAHSQGIRAAVSALIWKVSSLCPPSHIAATGPAGPPSWLASSSCSPRGPGGRPCGT